MENKMKKNVCSKIAVLSFGAALLLPVCAFAQTSAAQNQAVAFHHYKLIEIPTLGGPISSLSGPEQQTLNDQGTFAAFANTATPNPNANCFVPFNNPDCFVEHPVVLQNGKLTELALLPSGTNGQTD